MPGEPRRRVVVRPEAWRDREAIPSLMILSHSGTVLMPTVRLDRAAGVATEDLEVEIELAGVSIDPGCGVGARRLGSGVDEEHRFAVDMEEVRVGTVVAGDVGQIVA